MTDKELIKQEIERRLNLYESQFTGYELGRKDEAKSILDFIDSLPEEPKCIYNRTLEERKQFCKYCSAFCTVRIEEEPASEDLEEEILCRWEDNPHTLWPKCPYSDFKNIARHFAEWQEQKMMENAVECTWGSYATSSFMSDYPNIECGDKVQIIVVKKD